MRQTSKHLIIRQREGGSVSNATDESAASVAAAAAAVAVAEVERDTPRVAPLSPQHIHLPSSSPVVQIACGMHHTVVLTLAGEVFTFGSNQYGQLGTGDLQPHVGPVEVKVYGMISQIAAGSNHSVLLTVKGVVYTFGNHQKGQLGRSPNDDGGGGQQRKNEADDSEGGQSSANLIMQERQKYLWNCSPGAVW